MRLARGITGTLGTGVTLAILHACSVREVDFEGKACPCPSPWKCDAATQRCTRNGGQAGSGGAGGSGATSNGGSDGGKSQGGTGAAAGASADAGGHAGGSSNAGSAGTGVGGAGAGIGGDPTGGAGGDACGLSDGGRTIFFLTAGSELWIDPSKNCLGIKGQVTSNVELASSSGGFCMTGVAPAGGLQSAFINLGVEMGVAGSETYDAAAHGVTGFEFAFFGPTIPSALRFGFFDGTGGMHCLDVDGTTPRHSVSLSDAHTNCFSNQDTGAPDTSLLQLLVFVVPAPASGDVPFDFCIGDFKAVVP